MWNERCGMSSGDSIGRSGIAMLRGRQTDVQMNVTLVCAMVSSFFHDCVKRPDYVRLLLHL